ncbi:PAS domain-containing protein [Sphingomonas sp. LY54]|uniref:PAS domain-containing sensor histidine kinase n=1 Tax=Sphingomonas sp. LY54 TaxID=3095343 RepID=UPI002D77D8B2|nr:PAS domain-containing protein [Sphingomonas sp. LY54]WRP28254.1 PAS domain-containing protein [Sphingomonas sp. LY54]
MSDRPQSERIGYRVAVLAADEDCESIRAIVCERDCECLFVSPEQLLRGIAEARFEAAVLTGVALLALDLAALVRVLADQPSWLDFPFVLIASREKVDQVAEALDRLGHVAIVERPVHAPILRNEVRKALRLRDRQKQAGAYLEQKEASEAALSEANALLEARVEERTRALQEAVERLRQSEELYRYTLELSQQIVWTADAEGAILTVSPRFYELTKLDPTQPAREAIHPDDVDRVLAEWNAARADLRRHQVAMRLRMDDGSYRRFLARAAPRTDEKGRIVGWYGTMEDVHDQWIADQHRAAIAERYRMAALAADDAIWDHDLIGNSIWWTDAASGFLGLPGGEGNTPSEYWEQHLHPDDRARVVHVMWDAINAGRNRWSSGYRFLAGNGEYVDVFDRGFVIRDDEGHPIRAVGAMADITDRRHAEAELRKLQAELIHVSRLSAMGAMASTLAHEINQPLTAITGYLRGSQRLLADQPDAEEVVGALEAAEASALRAGHIVRRLRELVARGNVAVRTEDVARMIEEAAVLAFIDEQVLGVAHQIHVDPDARWVEADSIQIQQVLINLVRNAIEAMKDLPRREVTIATRAVGGGLVEVSVADTGTGLSEEVADALFSPFRTTKSEGMGIGLSISRTIIEAHGGKIWAENRPEGGAVFRFTLPGGHVPAEPSAGGDASKTPL